MLCQIDHCRVYAIKHSRDLWIDTRRSGFHDCLSNYFKPSRELHFGSPIGKACSDTSCFPAFLVHKVDSYERVYDPYFRNYVEKKTGKPLTFNFNAHYHETLLLHEQCGGGDNSIKMLARLRLKPDIKHKIKQVIGNLGRYDSIHVRNTDLTTDYKTFFDSLNDKIKGKVVVCTDDFGCQQYARTFWGHRLVVTHSVPDTSGAPLHYYEGTDQYTINLETLIDLFVLAAAENFYCCKTDQGRVSGFAQLVESLRSNTNVIKKLIYER